MPKPFLDDNEFFLNMDISYVSPLGQRPKDKTEAKKVYPPWIKEDELKMLRDVGIKTTMPFMTYWPEIEPEMGAPLDWSLLDSYVERAQRVGMKVILFTATHYPEYFPEDWYVWDAMGKVRKEALSPWNAEAQGYNNQFNQKIMDHFASETVMVANSQLLCGETILLNEPAFYDPHALKSFQRVFGSSMRPEPNEKYTEDWLKQSYINMLVDQQNILVDQPSREIWCMLHPAISHMPELYGNGNKWIASVLHAYITRVLPAKINHIYYTWIQWPMFWPEMNAYREGFHENVFGGAEWADGLPVTTPHAIEQGLRGQIIAPCYPGVHEHVEPYMLENIKNAQALWETSRLPQP